MAFVDLPYDSIFIETEHEGFDASRIGETLRCLNQPSRLGPGPTPLVRIPPCGREHNQFFAKQALDQGAFGIIFPHIETVDQALNAVAACDIHNQRGRSNPFPKENGALTRAWPQGNGVSAPRSITGRSGPQSGSSEIHAAIATGRNLVIMSFIRSVTVTAGNSPFLKCDGPATSGAKAVGHRTIARSKNCRQA